MIQKFRVDLTLSSSDKKPKPPKPPKPPKKPKKPKKPKGQSDSDYLTAKPK